MKSRPQQSQRSHDRSAILCSYLPMKCHIFQGRLSMCSFGYSSRLCGPFAFQPSAIPSDNHTSEIPSFRVTSSIGTAGLLDAGETQTVWMRTRTFSCLLFLLLLFFQIKVALQVGYLSTRQKLCSVLPLDFHRELLKRFFQLHFFANLPEIFTSYYFRTYRVRVTMTSFFIHICV